MKLLDKLKTALFEEDEEEIVETREVKTREKKDEQIVHKIDVEKTTSEKSSEITLPKINSLEPEIKKPIIFDDEDFMSDTKEMTFKNPPKKEDKLLYHGYEANQPEKPKEKFKPSPILSPVYGILSGSKEDLKTSDSSSLDYMFSDEKKKGISFDEIREKAYGINTNQEEVLGDDSDSDDDDSGLLYDMEQDEEMPGIDKVTIGDAEEYFDDLGLEYEVDYKDAAKAKSKQKMTRSKKNKSLSEVIESDDEISYNDVLNEQEEERIKKIVNKGRKKIDDDYQQPEEKNLYDLIDMMYDNK